MSVSILNPEAPQLCEGLRALLAGLVLCQSMMADAAAVPPVSVADVLACQYSSWRRLFRGKPRCLPRSTIVPLPRRFVNYLHADSIVLPAVPEGVSVRPDDPRFGDNDVGGDDAGSWASSSDDDGEGGGKVELEGVGAAEVRVYGVLCAPTQQCVT